MVAYTYSKLPTANFNTTPPSIARSATGSVYDKGDTGFTTPLNMTMVIGGAVVTTISSDALGFLPDFTLLDRVNCVWKQTGSTFATVLTTSDPIPGPPGPNTVPTDTAIASNISTPGTATAGALNATYEPKGTAASTVAAAVAPLAVKSAGLKNLRNMVPVATHAQTNVFTESNGTDTTYMTRVRHMALAPASSVAPVFHNFKSVANGTTELPGSNDITVRASVVAPFDKGVVSTNRPSGDANFFFSPKDPLFRWRVGDFIVSAPGTAREETLTISAINTGTGYITTSAARVNNIVVGDTILACRAQPLYFRGQRDITLAPGTWVQADPVAIDHAGPNAAQPYFWTRTYVTCAAGGKIPLNVLAHTSFDPGDGVEKGTTANDKTLTGVITPSATATYGYGPCAMVGDSVPYPKVWAVLGDSIPTGQGDGLGDNGYVTKAFLEAKLPLIKVTQGGERAAAITGPGYRGAFVDGATDVIYEYPTNDIFSGAGPLTAMQAANMAVHTARYYASRGARFYMSTIVPRNTSTDLWATLANQTLNTALTTERTTFNDWVRAGCPVDGSGNPVPAGTAGATPSTYVTGYLEIADVVENSRNDNKWKVNGNANYLTGDGVHPTTAGHDLMKAVVKAFITA